MVNSIVMESAGVRFAIISFDLLAIDFQEADEIRVRLAHLGFEPNNVLVAATHTHSAPASLNIGRIEKNGTLIREVVDTAERTVSAALQSLSATSVQTGHVDFLDNVNRRQRNWRRHTFIGVNLKGPVDHQVSFHALQNQHGRAIVVCYGSHPVINGSTVESADYVAGIRRTMAASGFDVTCFMCGALGDVNPYNRTERRAMEKMGTTAALEYGGRLGRKILDAVPNQTALRNAHVKTTSAFLDVSLPTLASGTLQRRLRVQAMRIGQFAMVAFPGEIFAETAFNLRSSSSINTLTIVSCANGYIGYVAPREEFAKGGYEIDEAPLLFGFRVPKGVAEEVQHIAEQAIASLFQQ
jgi:neutral ceramidase